MYNVKWIRMLSLPKGGKLTKRFGHHLMEFKDK